MLSQRAHSWTLRNVVLPIGDRLLGQGLMPRLRFLEEAQWWDADRIRTERDKSLQDLIQVAYGEVGLYRTLMDDRGLKPESIRTPEDLRHLPVVTKDVLRGAYPDGATRPTGNKTYESRTSGSTGKNFVVLWDRETEGRQRAAFMLALGWAGWKPGEPHLQTGITFKRSLDRKLKDALLRCHYMSAAALGDDQLEHNLDVLATKKIKHLWGYPGSLYVLGKYALKQGWNMPLRSIVTWGDKLYPHYRDTLQRAFGTNVTDTYGCSEGIEISAQCGHGDAYHIHELDTIVEIIDDDGRPALAGQPGHLVLTRLHPGPMPLIRYQVGDVGVRGTTDSCTCGRHLATMNGIQGRDTDIVVTPSGNRLIVHFFTGILSHVQEIDSFQVVQETPSAIRLRIQPVRTISNETITRTVSALKEGGAKDLEIEVEVVEEIPLTPGGKRRFVINKCREEVLV